MHFLPATKIYTVCWALGSIMPTILQFVQYATIDDKNSTRVPLAAL